MRMNAGLNYQVRQGARNIRRIYSEEGGLDSMRAAKEEALRSIYQILCIHLGNPPASFDWQWKDKDGEFHRDGAMTPLEFAEKYINTPMEEFVCLVHDPRTANPPGRTYTVQYLGNVVDGTRIKYLNVDIELMKDITMRMLQDGQPVWMGCDTGKQMHRDKGLWDADLFDYASVYNAEFSMDKEERLEYHQTAMTHAMLFTGVDVVDGKPPPLARGEQLGRQGWRKGVLPDERLLVRGVYVRDRRAEELSAGRLATGPRPGAGGAAPVGPDGVAGRPGSRLAVIVPSLLPHGLLGFSSSRNGSSR